MHIRQDEGGIDIVNVAYDFDVFVEGCDVGFDVIPSMAGQSNSTTQERATPLPQCVYQPQVIDNYDQLTIAVAIQIKRRDGKRVITDDKGRDLIVSEATPSATLLQAIAKGMAIQQACIEQQISIGAWVKQHQVSPKARQCVALATLSPTVIESITIGKQPSHWTVKRLLETAKLPIWSERHQLLGLER